MDKEGERNIPGQRRLKRNIKHHILFSRFLFYFATKGIIKTISEM
jgi:hypothetical protein